MLTLKQFTGSLVTPTDDALFYDFLLSGQCGIFEGCEVTHLGANQLRVSSGRGVILGRIFTVEEETIQAAVSPGGEVDGRLLIRVDMGNEEKPIEFVTQAETPLPELIQEDINRDGSVYELPLAVYKVTELLISGLERVAEPVQTPIDDSVRQAVQELQAGKFNAAAQRSGTTVAITGPAEAQTITFPAPADWTAGDSYTYNGQPLTLTDLNREPVEDAWKAGSPVTFYLSGGAAFFKAGGMGKLPSDLAPLCPNFTVERTGGKVKISADKIQLNSYTNMVSGGVWAWGKTRPTKPTGENTKQWSKAELITTGKPYDGLYLGDVTPSDAVTETLIYLPENQDGKIVLVPFLVLSTDYLGGVYVMRQKGNKDWVGKYGNNVTYENSTADTWLTSYLNSVLDKSIVDKVLECEIHVFEQGTIKRKCWIPSYGELYSDFTDSGNTFMPYFNSNGRRALIKQDDGNLLSYWTRTFYNLSNVRMINPDGSGYFQSASNKTAAYRPAFVLPKDFKIQQRPDGSYTVWNEQGLMKLSDIGESTDTIKVVVNIAEVDRNVPVLYLSSNYNGTERGLIRYLNSAGVNTTWGSSSSNFSNSTLKGAVDSYCESKLSESVKNIVSPVTIKITNAAGSDYTTLSTKYFVLSSAEYGGKGSDGTPIAFFSDNTNRSGFTHHTRSKFSPSESYYVESAGAIGTTSISNTSIPFAPAFTLPLTTPIRLLADGSYDLVPEDPALSAQGVSTMAEEEEVPLEIELDWPESDPLIARQWVYNEKGVYQTMLLGGIASTEDAPAYSPVLSENTWEQIAQACADRDPILDSWLVGDEKDEVINGETLTFVIVGKDHDDLADGSGKAPLTFGMKNLMAETRKMNSSNTNSGSFAGSAMYSWLSGTIYPNLPTELKDAIKAVNKKTSSGGASSTIRTDAMYLWLFAEIEVFGSTTYSYAGEGTQYPYFATSAERIKRLSNGAGAASYWWERSPYRNNSGHFCGVDTSGSASSSYASSSSGVCFGFCIG